MRFKRLALLGVMTLGLATQAFAQAWPSKPVRLVVPFPAGGSTDVVGRVIAQELSLRLGQSVVVDNRGGASGTIGSEVVARTPPDGYTLLSAPVGNLAVNPHLYPKFALDVFKDLTPITLVASVQNVLVVNPAVPAATLAELVALAKQKPASLTFASGGSGTQAHLGGEILKSMAGIEINHVPYKGVGDAVRDLLGGHVQLMVAQLPSVLQQIQAGKLRALGLAAVKRTSVLPNLPTLNEAGGFTGFEAVSWYALAGPAGIPKPIVDRIQADVVRALALPDVREKLLALGADPVGSTPQELSAAMKVDYDRYGAVIKRLGIKAE